MPVGLLPVAIPASVYLIGGGAAVESAWAWYNPEVFEDILTSSSIERKIAGLNNAFHLLWRTMGTMPQPADERAVREVNAAVAQLDADMGGWWTWKKQYNEAMLTSWIPFVGDWEDELNSWLRKFQEDNEKMALAYAAAEGSRREWTNKLRASGLDARDFEPDVTVAQATKEIIRGASETITDTTRAGLFWPSMAVVAVLGGMLWLGARAGSPRAA